MAKEKKTTATVNLKNRVSIVSPPSKFFGISYAPHTDLPYIENVLFVKVFLWICHLRTKSALPILSYP